MLIQKGLKLELWKQYFAISLVNKNLEIDPWNPKKWNFIFTPSSNGLKYQKSSSEKLYFQLLYFGSFYLPYLCVLVFPALFSFAQAALSGFSWLSFFLIEFFLVKNKTNPIWDHFQRLTPNIYSGKMTVITLLRENKTRFQIIFIWESGDMLFWVVQ